MGLIIERLTVCQEVFFRFSLRESCGWILWFSRGVQILSSQAEKLFFKAIVSGSTAKTRMDKRSAGGGAGEWRQQCLSGQPCCRTPIGAASRAVPRVLRVNARNANLLSGTP